MSKTARTHSRKVTKWRQMDDTAVVDGAFAGDRDAYAELRMRNEQRTINGHTQLAEPPEPPAEEP